MQSLCVTEAPEIQHRGCYIIRNLISSDKDIANKVIASTLMEVLMAITLLTEPDRAAVKQCAQEALDIAKEHGLIKSKDHLIELTEET